MSCYFSFPAKATLKIDITGIVGSVTEYAGQLMGKASDLQKQVEHVKTYQKLLDGAKEGFNKYNKLKEELSNEINNITSQVNAVKGTVQNAVNTAQNVAGEVTSSVTGVVDTAKSSALELTSLTNELAQLESQFETQLKDLEDERDSKIEPYKQNNEVMQRKMAEDPSQQSALQAKIDENNEKIQEITAEYQAKIEEQKQRKEQLSSALNEKINTLKEAATFLNPMNDLSVDSAKNVVSGLFKGDASAVMNETAARNFYGADEQESADRNNEITTYRKNAYLNDSADVYNSAVQEIAKGDENINISRKFSENTANLDTTPAQVTLVMSMKVVQMRQLLQWARLMTAELKKETAKDMMNLPKILNNPEKDIQAFNLDDYNKDAKTSWKDELKKLGSSGLKNIYSSVADGISTAKSIFGSDNSGDETLEGGEETALNATEGTTNDIDMTSYIVNDSDLDVSYVNGAFVSDKEPGTTPQMSMMKNAGTQRGQTNVTPVRLKGESALMQSGNAEMFLNRSEMMLRDNAANVAPQAREAVEQVETVEQEPELEEEENEEDEAMDVVVPPVARAGEVRLNVPSVGRSAAGVASTLETEEDSVEGELENRLMGNSENVEQMNGVQPETLQPDLESELSSRLGTANTTSSALAPRSSLSNSGQVAGGQTGIAQQGTSTSSGPNATPQEMRP